MFFILGISISVFLVFLLLIKKNRNRADNILLIWLVLMFVHQLLHYQLYTGELFNYPYLLGVEFPMPVLHGVLLYFYVSEITGKGTKRVTTILLHLIPTLSLAVLAIPFYRLSGPEKLAVFDNNAKDYQWYVIYQSALIFVSGIAYSVWSLFLIRKYQNNIQDNFSNTDKKELQWLQYLAVGLGAIWFLTLFANSVVIFSGVVVFVLFIGFFGINQMTIFYTHQPPEIILHPKPEATPTTKTASLDSKSKRYVKSGLTEEMAEDLYDRLNILMAETTPFKNNELTLTELAKQLEVHPNHLSQVINEKEQQNFYNYINALRIKAFIQLASLPENKKFTLLSLALECGFNSKSTFNKHFKKNTGKTPSEYFKL